MSVIAALALFGILAACADGDSDVPTEPVTILPALTGAQVVRFPAKDPETERFAVDGVIDENGKCRLNRQFESPPGVTTRVFESVVEFDPTSCKFVVARHSPEAIPDHVLEDFRTFRDRVSASRRNAVSSDPDVESYQTNIEEWAPSSGCIDDDTLAEMEANAVTDC